MWPGSVSELNLLHWYMQSACKMQHGGAWTYVHTRPALKSAYKVASSLTSQLEQNQAYR